MRRSNAPSIRNKIKNRKSDCEFTHKTVNKHTPEVNSVKWRRDRETVLTESNGDNRNPLNGKRVFRVLWRDISTKKHKSWKSDGTFVLTGKSAILKDDAGQYMDSIHFPKPCDLHEGVELTIGNKEIQLQDEIKSAEEYWQEQKQQLLNGNSGNEEPLTEEQKQEEERKPKGSFLIRPLLHLTKPHNEPPPLKKLKGHMPQNELICWESEPKVTNTTKSKRVSKENDDVLTWGTVSEAIEPIKLQNEKWLLEETLEPNSNSYTANFVEKFAPIITEKQQLKEICKKTEYICFLQPSELQEQLLRTCHKFCSNTDHVFSELHTPNAVLEICQQICDHPILLQESNASDTKLMALLTKQLPEWSEMGPYDSAKFELLQMLLNRFVLERREKCIIVVKDSATTIVLQGYCNHMNINVVVLDENVCETDYPRLINRFNVPTIDDINSPCVAFIQSKIDLAGTQITNAKRVIYYNFVPRSKLESFLFKQTDLKIYHLVTAGCFEEALFQQQLLTPEFDIRSADFCTLLSVILESATCLTHESLGCECDGDGNYTNDSTNIGKEDDLYKLLKWEHCKPPFTVAFLQSSELTEEAQHIKFVFSKTNFC